MRSAVFLIGLVLLLIPLAYIGNFLRLFYNENKDLISPLSSPGASQESQDFKNYVDVGGTRIVWFEVLDISKLELHSNLGSKKTAKHLYEEKGCELLVNGGFYTKEGKHIGLFATEGKVLSESSNSDLFNGYFTIKDNKPVITNTQVNGAKIALQAGPILLENGKPKVLSIKNDEEERRLAVVITQKEGILFLVFFKKDSVFLGPKLTQLPDLLITFGSMTGILPVSALNLDGGTASAFYTKGFSLGELSKIGSYFCVDQ